MATIGAALDIGHFHDLADELDGVGHDTRAKDSHPAASVGTHETATKGNLKAAGRPPDRAANQNRSDIALSSPTAPVGQQAPTMDGHGDSMLAMTTIEIAELTGKRHSNVTTDTRNMLIELYGQGGLLNFQDTRINPQNGQSYPGFKLPKRETLILVSGYSIAMRAKIIDRWQELEAAAPTVNPAALSRMQLLELAMQAEQERVALEHKVAALLPKADAFDRIAGADGSCCVTDAARILQMRPKELFGWLHRHGWIFRRTGCTGWRPHSDRVNQGLLRLMLATMRRDDGSEKTVEQLKVTRRGLTRLAELFDDAGSAD